MSAPQTTNFEHMSGLARELGAINLGQGFPELPEPPELIAAAQRALAGKSNQYPPMRGIPELRSAVADYYLRTQGLTLSAEQVIVTSGGTEALAASLFALVAPGDEVLLVQPLYDAYLPLVQWAGGTAKVISLGVAERNAAMLGRYIVKSGLRTFNKRALKRSPHKSGLPSLRDAKAMDAALEVLIDADLIRLVGKRDGDGPGRASGDYAVNPVVHGGKR